MFYFEFVKKLFKLRNSGTDSNLARDIAGIFFCYTVLPNFILCDCSQSLIRSYMCELKRKPRVCFKKMYES